MFGRFKRRKKKISILASQKLCRGAREGDGAGDPAGQQPHPTQLWAQPFKGEQGRVPRRRPPSRRVPSSHHKASARFLRPREEWRKQDPASARALSSEPTPALPKARPDLQGRVIPAAAAKADRGVLGPLVSHGPLGSRRCPTLQGSLDKGLAQSPPGFPNCILCSDQKYHLCL